MTSTQQPLFSLAIAATLASLCAPVFAQSLAMTYGLDANTQAQRSSISNSGCAAYSWIASVRSCDQQPSLGRYSRGQGDEGVGRLLPRTGRAPNAAGASNADTNSIPFLGEATRPAAAEPRVHGEPELNVKMDRPRMREDLERRFHDAAQDARFNKNAINALGLEVVVPIQSKLRQSADPALPQ